LFDSWISVRAGLDGARVYLMLDYDGTLAPISSTPEDAVLPAAAKAALQCLASHDSRRLAIVSGRALADVRSMTGIEGIAYVGNHGWEILRPDGGREERRDAHGEPLMEGLKAELRRALKRYRGVRFEDKGPAFTVHFRLVDRSVVPDLLGVFDEIVGAGPAFHVGTGKMVREVRPLGPWNKGTAVRRLLDLESAEDDGGVIPLYIGDDDTDEDAFREIGGDGVTIRVGGPAPTYAAYYLNDTGEVTKLLNILCIH